MLVYQLLPSRYGMNPDDLRRADAIEVVIGQGAKPGGGGMLLGQKISERVAEMRTLPEGIDQRSACRHPDWTGPDDLEIKIEELREITDWEKPIYVKVGASRPYYDIGARGEGRRRRGRARRHAGRHRGHPGSLHRARRHSDPGGYPAGGAGAAGPRHAPQGAAHRLRRHAQRRRRGQGLALGADAVSIGTAALVALGDNDPRSRGRVRGARHHRRRLRRLARGPRSRRHHHAGCGAGARGSIRSPAGRKLANYLAVLTLEAQTIARACGKSHVHNLEPEDLVALTVEAAAMARVPLAGTDWIPG